MERETSPTLAGPSQMNQNNLLVDFSKCRDLSTEEEVEAVEAEVAEEEAGMTPTQMMTPMPLPPRPQTESSMVKNQQSLQETKK